MKNIAVFVSGNGTNLQAIIDDIAAGKLKAGLALVVSDKKDAFALKRAKKLELEDKNIESLKQLKEDDKNFKDEENILRRLILKKRLKKKTNSSKKKLKNIKKINNKYLIVEK